MKRIIIFLSVVVVVVLAGIYVDKHLKGGGFNLNPPSSNSQAAGLIDQGPAPEFIGIDHWLNSDPLTMKSLRGKVVLIDFWTYSCINCIRTLPYVTRWYDTYKDKGFVVVGVHTPEFAFEKETANVADAISRFNIHYPVAQDNNYATWTAYGNQYWPAEYLIDKNGHIIHEHFGEGEYDQTENTIRSLLGLSSQSNLSAGQDLSGVGSPEMYFGTERLANLSSSQSPNTTATNYVIPASLDLNNFALQGQWQFSSSEAKLIGSSGKIRLKFHSGKLYMVAASGTTSKLTIVVDGKVQNSVVVGGSKLYTLFDSNDYSDHVVEIQIDGSGFEAFTFTFG